MIPEQVWDSAAPSGYTPGTPTKSMDPLNWSMAQYIALLFSASTSTVADQPSLTKSRYVTGAFQPHTGYAVDYNSAQLYQGKALTIYYHGSLDNSSHVYLHWGENGWQNIAAADKPMVKRADGFWQTTISVPVDATSLNFVFTDGTNWDNNGGGNWNISIGAGTTYPALSTPVMTFPYVAVQSQSAHHHLQRHAGERRDEHDAALGLQRLDQPDRRRDDQAKRRLVEGDDLRPRQRLLGQHGVLQPERDLGQQRRQQLQPERLAALITAKHARGERPSWSRLAGALRASPAR